MEAARETPFAKVHEAGRYRAAKFLPLIYGAALCSGLGAWCWLKQSPVRPRPSPPIVSQESCSPFGGGIPGPLNSAEKHAHRTPAAWHQKFTQVRNRRVSKLGSFEFLLLLCWYMEGWYLSGQFSGETGTRQSQCGAG